jgi:hypothetical protein
MALLTVATVVAAGAAVSLTAVAASDTIATADVGTRGLIYEVSNAGGSTDTVTISDPGTTAAGNAGVAATVAVAAGARKRMYIGPANVNQTTGVATVSHSFTTSVTAEAYKF